MDHIKSDLRAERHQLTLCEESRLSSKQLALAALYIDIPPRRGDDYRLMRIVRKTSEQQIADLPREHNYLVVDKDNVALKMIINQYKTQKDY